MVKKTTTPKKTTTRSKTAPTPATAEKPAPKPATEDAVKTATVVKAMGKRELIDRVVTSSGIKKKAAKPVVEAMLKELGDALSRGETLNLQPFGKGIVKSRKELENAEIVELRLRRSKLALKAAEVAETERADDTSDGDSVAEAAE